MINDLTKQEIELLQKLAIMKKRTNCTWLEIGKIANKELGTQYSPDRFRKLIYQLEFDTEPKEEGEQFSFIEHFKDVTREALEKQTTPSLDDIALTEAEQQALDAKLETLKSRDERTQVNALYRRMSREQTIKEIAEDLYKHMDAQFKLPVYKATPNGPTSAILQISDWHYGIEIDSFWNKYNTEIAKERIAKLQEETIRICKQNNVSTLCVVNLGDLIAGRIHLQLRINSRIDVITQIMEVSELLAQMLSNLSEHFNIYYFDTLDNHSRLEPNLKESIDLESLARITTWYLKLRVPSIKVCENTFADDIITFTIQGHDVVAVHGDKDKPAQLIDNLSMMTENHYDLALSAHLHHFSAEEKNKTILISNSSLMGTDDYAEKLRLSAQPSQNLIIVTPENVTEAVYRIKLD